ncbi:MAG: MBL fold metallo-hydrolase, partial [Anaerovoracaceae bacterium]
NLPSGPLMVNTYLATDEETGKGFIVDPGGFDQRLVDEVHREQIEIEYIILTHGHADHMGGVHRYQELYPNAKLVAAAAEEKMLADPNLNFSVMTLGAPIVLQADILVGEGDILNVGNLELKFIMTPGHTEGGMCILSGNVLFSGDTLFQASIGRTDFPGGSFPQLRDAIHQKLFVLPDQINVFPGHMGYTTIGEEKRNNPFV